jgi:excisionase family DNA binding protein
MAKGKNVLTTGEVAKICNVAPRTVSKWFDSGQLKGYRIPGSKDRRIPVSELMRFMKLHNMPASSLHAGKIRILIVDSDTNAASQLADELTGCADYEVQTVNSNFQTGAVAQKFAPHAMLVNLLAKDIDAVEICRNIRGNDDLQTIKMIALASRLSKAELDALMQKGFDGFVTNAADIHSLVEEIEKVTAIIY